MIETAVKGIAALENRDPPLNASMPFTNSSEPGLFLVLTAYLRFLPWFRQDNSFDASVLGFGLIIG
jgi:hypothetical protein